MEQPAIIAQTMTSGIVLCARLRTLDSHVTFRAGVVCRRCPHRWAEGDRWHLEGAAYRCLSRRERQGMEEGAYRLSPRRSLEYLPGGHQSMSCLSFGLALVSLVLVLLL